MPLGTLRYGELVAMIYAPGIIGLLVLSVSAIRRRRAGHTLPKR